MIRGRIIFTNDIHPYGIDIDTTTGAVTRIGDIRGHRQLPVQNSMIGGTITADGTFTPFVNQSDWTAAENQSRDGSAGNCVVKIPLHYVKYETIGTHIRAWVSHLWHQGFSIVGDYYVGAHEATINRDTGALADVVSMDAKYRGGNNTSSWDGTYRTMLGKPATNISLTNFRNAARLINNGDTRHNITPYYKHKDLVWLICIEYANLNSQAEFNPNLDANGFHQGGLGVGVSTIIEGWDDYNNMNPVVPCGVTDTLGNSSGVVSYSIPDESDGVFATVSVPRYRGIENIFGHLMKLCDGLLVHKTDNGNEVYVTEYPMQFASSYENYTYKGYEVAGSGSVRKIMFGDSGDIIPTKGSNNPYYQDGFYTVAWADIMILMISGVSNYGSRCGLFYWETSVPTSYSRASSGTRYCYIP